MFLVKLLYVDDNEWKEEIAKQLEPEDIDRLYNNDIVNFIPKSDLTDEKYLVFRDLDDKLFRLNLDRVIMIERICA